MSVPTSTGLPNDHKNNNNNNNDRHNNKEHCPRSDTTTVSTIYTNTINTITNHTHLISAKHQHQHHLR